MRWGGDLKIKYLLKRIRNRIGYIHICVCVCVCVCVYTLKSHCINIKYRCKNNT